MITPADLRHLADQIDADHRYGVVARLITCAILRGLADQITREGAV